jgi:general L-amino acid transport system substrate-binding protein
MPCAAEGGNDRICAKQYLARIGLHPGRVVIRVCGCWQGERSIMKRLHTRLLAGLAVCATFVVGAAAARAQDIHSPTLDAVKQRGQLVCGVDSGIPGYAFQDASGKWLGLDVSLCRALATAILGDPDKVKYIGLTSEVRFTVLKSAEIDVLIRDSEHTFVRNTQLGLAEPVTNFYTGQGFMVRKSLNVTKVKDLDGATICVETGTTLEKNIADFNRINNVKIGTLLFERPEQAFAAVEAGRCDGYTDDAGSVAAARSSMKNPANWTILDETISRELIGPYTRQGDEAWTNIVKWTHFAMLEGEVLGLTKANVVDAKKTATDPSMRKFLGLEGGFGKMLGLDDDWSFRIIRDVGNYGEVYDAYFGAKGLGLPRGMNNLWTNGGLQIPPPWY